MHRISFFFLLLLTFGCGVGNSSTAQGTNDSECDSGNAPLSCLFPPKHETGPAVWLAGEMEPGEPMTISGSLLDKKKKPLPGYILYVYQTDATGRYTKTGDETGVQKWHGHLHGWVQTDADGRFEINSIRPAPYPNGGIPAHLHCAVKPPNGEPFYINDFVFADDPLVTKTYLKRLSYDGGDGVVDLQKNENGEWIGERVLVLSRKQ